MPLDGVIIKGSSSLDTKALTGESMPVEVKDHDPIISGSINLNGVLEVRVTKLFDDSTVAKILELVENASSRKAKAENFITKFAWRWFWLLFRLCSQPETGESGFTARAVSWLCPAHAHWLSPFRSASSEVWERLRSRES